MGQLIVRGLDDDLIRALKQRAGRSGRSAEAEHRTILEQALRSEIESFAAAAARVRARTPPQSTDSKVSRARCRLTAVVSQSMPSLGAPSCCT